jgi:hypothetical protein
MRSEVTAGQMVLMKGPVTWVPLCRRPPGIRLPYTGSACDFTPPSRSRHRRAEVREWSVFQPAAAGPERPNGLALADWGPNPPRCVGSWGMR